MTTKPSSVCILGAGPTPQFARAGHVGLGNESSVDRVEVHWPDGSVEEWTGVNVDIYTTLSKGSGSKAKSGK